MLRKRPAFSGGILKLVAIVLLLIGAPFVYRTCAVL
jgi:hypothetical protein